MEKSKLTLVGLALTGLGAAMTTSVMAASPVKVGGLIQTDFVSFQNDAGKRLAVTHNWTDEFNTSVALRRAGFYFKGEIDDCWSYQVTWDVKGATWDDTWIGFAGFDPVWIAVGRITPPQGLENWMSSTATTFMERAGVSVFAPDSGLGIYAEGTTGVVAYAASFTGPDHGITSSTLSSSDPWLFAARVTVAPTDTEDNVIHLGGSYNYGNVDKDTLWTLSASPAMIARSTPTLVTTHGVAGEADNFMNWGLEAAGRWGPLLVMSEYQEYEIDGRSGFGTLDYYGWYVDAAYVLTGESRAYDQASGTFGRVNPDSNTGAWEVAIRYDMLDLSHGLNSWTNSGSSGDVSQWVAAVNWYANNSVKLVAEYAHTEADYDSTSSIKDRDLDIFGIRAQLRF